MIQAAIRKIWTIWVVVFGFPLNILLSRRGCCLVFTIRAPPRAGELPTCILCELVLFSSVGKPTTLLFSNMQSWHSDRKTGENLSLGYWYCFLYFKAMLSGFEDNTCPIRGAVVAGIVRWNRRTSLDHGGHFQRKIFVSWECQWYFLYQIGPHRFSICVGVVFDAEIDVLFLLEYWILVFVLAEEHP